MSDVCTVCDGDLTVKYRDRKYDNAQTGDCYRCGGDGQEPMLPKAYGEGNSRGWCRLCTVIGGGHRTTCPDR